MPRLRVYILVLGAILFLTAAGEVMAATMKMRVVVVNPSKTKAQTKTVKTFFPKEITLKDVKDPGGLDIDYDESQGLLFAFKENVELAPSETKTFEIVMEDVWNVPDEQLSLYKEKTDRIMKRLKGTAYFTQADLLAKTVYGRLDEIKKTQTDTTAPKQQHIAYYRDNVKSLEGVKADLDKLEKILVTVGGAPNIELLEKSELELKSPSAKTTWIIIFGILIFIGVLSGTFYFTWLKKGSGAGPDDVFKPRP